jgi:hypothetical protein
MVQRGDEPAAHLLRRRIDLGDGIERGEHALHHALALVDVRQFTPPEHDRHDDLVLVHQERLRLIHLELDVVLAGLGAEADLLDLGVVDVRLVVLLLLLVLELAEVHDPADGRLLVRRHLDEVEARLPRQVQGLVRGDDAQLGAVGPDHADRSDPDLVVDAVLLLDGSLLPDRGVAVPSREPRRAAAHPGRAVLAATAVRIPADGRGSGSGEGRPVRRRREREAR